MRLGKVVGTVTASVKAERLVGLKLLVVDVVDASGEVLERACVAPDTCGAGVGDSVLLATGSGARMAAGLSQAPIDLAVVAIIDRVAVKP